MVQRQSRLVLGMVSFLMLLTTYGFIMQSPLLGDLWPWTSYSVELEPLSFYFLASIAAAIAAPLVWIAATGNFQTAPGGAINLAVTFGGIAVFFFQSHRADPGNDRLLPAAIVVGVWSLANLAIYFFTRKLPPIDPTPMPRPVCYSFWAFIVALVLVGGSMVLKVPNVMHWKITPEGSVVYGWLFLGASTYFAYALKKPLWENAVGPLLGFLAYDLVLIAPFLARFADVEPQYRTSLMIYTLVVVYSGLLATYYLFGCPMTRLVRRTT
jgi:hypothetical protein